MRAKSLFALSSALLLSSAAVAETKAPAEPVKGSSDKAAPAEKKICKRLATTGSRMEERVCLTKDEWKQVEEEVKG